MSELPSPPTAPTCPSVDARHLDERLDEAIDESFPASDPPAVSLCDEPPAKPRIESPVTPGLSPGPGQPGHRVRARDTAAMWFVRAVPAAVLTLGGLALARYLRRRRP